VANLITEPVSTSQYYTEYMQTILRYKSQTQKGIFIRDYNINVASSGNSTNTKSSMDSRSEFIYDVFEYTPVWSVDEVTDEIEDNPEKMGLSFSGITGITVHSITHPRVHDIISFSYPPYTLEHAYRVKGISTSLNARDAGIYVFKLELENAFNVSDLSKLNVADTFVYSMVDNINITRLKYESIMREHSMISPILKSLSFDSNLELYYYVDSNGNKISPLDSNMQLHSLLSKNNIRQYFGLDANSSFIVPWGITSYTSIAPDSYYDYASKTVIAGDGVILQSSVVSVRSYVSSIPSLIIQDCAKLLTLFQG